MTTTIADLILHECGDMAIAGIGLITDTHHGIHSGIHLLFGTMATIARTTGVITEAASALVLVEDTTLGAILGADTATDMATVHTDMADEGTTVTIPTEIIDQASHEAFDEETL